MTMWEPFTESARRSIVFAQEEVQRLLNNYVGSEHILLGIISESENGAAAVLRTVGVDLANARETVEAQATRGRQLDPQEMVFTEDAKRVIQVAFEEARALSHNYVGTETLLLGVIREADGLGAHALKNLGVDAAELRSRIIQRLRQEGDTPADGEP